MSVIIRLQNLPWSANASHIRRFFSGLNIPEGGVHIVGGENGDAFIGFATDDDARRSMFLNGQALNGASVKLMLSSVSEMQNVIAKARGHFASANPNLNISIETPVNQKFNEINNPRDEIRFDNGNSSQNKSNTYSYYEPNASQSSDIFNYPRGGFGSPQKEMTRPPRPPEIFGKHSAPEYYSNPDKSLKNDHRNPRDNFRDTSAAAPYRSDNAGSRLPVGGRSKVLESQNYPAKGGMYSDRYSEREKNVYSRYSDERSSNYENRPTFQESHDANRNRDYGFYRPVDSQQNTGNFRKLRPDTFEDRPQVFDYGHSTANKSRDDNCVRPLMSAEHGSRGGNSWNSRESRRDEFPNRFDNDDRAMRRPPKQFERNRPNDDRGKIVDYRNEFGEDHFSRPVPNNDISAIRPPYRGEDVPNIRRNEYPPPPSQNRFPEPRHDKSSLSRTDSDVRDFSVRPPWLVDGRDKPSRTPIEPNGIRKSDSHDVPKALMPTPEGPSFTERSGYKRQSNDNSGSNQPPLKHLKSDNSFSGTQSGDSHTVIRLSTIPEKTNVGALFQFLRGVRVVLKWGVRAENDKMNRPTGYVFIKCQTEEDAQRALTFSNQLFNGSPASITPSSDNEFFSSGDSPSFKNIPVPPHVTKGLSYYYHDNCVEITGLKKVVNKQELIEFFKLERVNNDDIFIGDFSSQMTVIRAFMKLPDRNQAEKVLGKSGVVFKDYGTIKTWPISVIQLEKFKKEAKKELSSDNTTQHSKPTDPDLMKTDPPKVKSEPNPPKPTIEKKPSNVTEAKEGELKHLEISNLPKVFSESDIKSLFPFLNLKLNRIHLIPKISTAVIEFNSSTESRKALFTNKRVLRGVTVTMKQISEARTASHIGNDSTNESVAKVTSQGDSQGTTDSTSKGNPEPEKPNEVKPSPITTTPTVKPNLESPKKTSQRFDVSVTNLPMGYSTDRVKDFFKGFALYPEDPVTLKLSAQGKPLGEATIAFRNAVEADRAIRDLNGRRLAGRSISMRSLH